MTDPNLITAIVLQGREYLVSMNVVNKYLELTLSDKQTGEEWQCSYDNSYIENLTHKTGNFKQFDVFIAMIKSGLLKTSDSINLELYTFEDLESLRIRKVRNHSSRSYSNIHNNNRRYLVLTYTVEFDRINYPLPLEYCGPPDPTVLQATIRKLESELSKVREELNFKNNRNESKQILALQRRIDDLTTENLDLQNEIDELTRINSRGSRNQVQMLQKAIVNLEKSVLSERKSHHKLVEKLRSDKIQLTQELEMVKSSEKSIKLRLEQITHKGRSKISCDKQASKLQYSDQSLQTIYRRPPSAAQRSSSDGNKAVRMRSMSPRITKSEGWILRDDKLNIRLPKNVINTKPKSRSSSLSSSKNDHMDDIHNYETEVFQNNISRRKSRRNKPNKANHSRSSSAASTGSSTMSEKLSKHSVSSIKGSIKKEKKDFQSLENRIHALQNILKENVRCAE